MNADEIAKHLAAKFSGISITKKAEPEPTPTQPRPRPTVAYSRHDDPEDRPRPRGDYITVGQHELKTSKLWPMESMALADDKRTGRPNRPPQHLTPSDWGALAEVPISRGMDFDAWVRHACLAPLVKDYDLDYPAAARLFLKLKKATHQR